MKKIIYCIFLILAVTGFSVSCFGQAAAGSIDYWRNSYSKAQLGIGTAGQVLTVNPGATAPIWTNTSTGTTSVTATSPLSVTSGSAIAISQANTSTNGYLSSTDWNTFNKSSIVTSTVTTATTLTVNVSNANLYTITSLSTATTFYTSGSPTDGQQITLRVLDNTTSQTLNFTLTGTNPFYFGSATPMPTTTVSGKMIELLFKYNPYINSGVWDCMVVKQN
jgi:hypothetical protein